MYIHRGVMLLIWMFQIICSYVLWPLSAIMGVEISDAGAVAKLLGIKIFVDEFISFRDLAILVKEHKVAVSIAFASHKGLVMLQAKWRHDQISFDDVIWPLLQKTIRTLSYLSGRLHKVDQKTVQYTKWLVDCNSKTTAIFCKVNLCQKSKTCRKKSFQRDPQNSADGERKPLLQLRKFNTSSNFPCTLPSMDTKRL